MTIDLTESDITLLRVALMQRCDNLKHRLDMKVTYLSSIDLLNRLDAIRRASKGEPK